MTKHLSIKEKRDWLATIFRDESGEFSSSDKFKAMTEDTRLAMLAEEQKSKKTSSHGITLSPELLAMLPARLNHCDADTASS